MVSSAENLTFQTGPLSNKWWLGLHCFFNIESLFFQFAQTPTFNSFVLLFEPRKAPIPLKFLFICNDLVERVFAFPGETPKNRDFIQILKHFSLYYTFEFVDRVLNHKHHISWSDFGFWILRQKMPKKGNFCWLGSNFFRIENL